MKNIPDSFKGGLYGRLFGFKDLGLGSKLLRGGIISRSSIGIIKGDTRSLDQKGHTLNLREICKLQLTVGGNALNYPIWVFYSIMLQPSSLVSVIVYTDTHAQFHPTIGVIRAAHAKGRG